MTPAGYSLYEEPRPGEKRGGGVAIICKANLKVKKAKRFKSMTFESLNALITSGRKSVRLVVVYRHPSKKYQNATAFLAEFAVLLKTLALDNANLIIVGDFNIHMDDQTSRTCTANMVDLLAENDLTQRVYGLTHRDGHTLYIILTRGYGEHSFKYAEQRSWDFRPQAHRLITSRRETTWSQKTCISAEFQTTQCRRPVQ